MERPPLLAAAAATEPRPAAGDAEDMRCEREARAGEAAAAGAAAATTREEEQDLATGAARAELERTTAQALEAVARAAISDGKGGKKGGGGGSETCRREEERRR